MEDFPSNSSRQPRPLRDELREKQPAQTARKVTRVVEGEVVRRKKPLGKRIRESLMPDDQTSIGEFLILEFIIPGIRDLLYDASIGSIERVFHRGEPPIRGRRPSQRGARVSYDRYSRDPVGRASGRFDRDDRDRGRDISRRARAVHDFDEVILPSRHEAQETLSQMYDMLERYETVSVADLYQMVGVTPEYTDNKWGWVDLGGSDISSVRGGYLLNLPRPEQLD